VKQSDGVLLAALTRLVERAQVNSSGLIGNLTKLCHAAQEGKLMPPSQPKSKGGAPSKATKQQPKAKVQPAPKSWADVVAGHAPAVNDSTAGSICWLQTTS